MLRSKTPHELLCEVVENGRIAGRSDLWLNFLSWLRGKNFDQLMAFNPEDMVGTAELYIRDGVLDRLAQDEDDMEAAWFNDFNRRPDLRAAVHDFLRDRNFVRFLDKTS